MPKCTIDGRTVEFTAGENLVEVAKRAGVEIPVFCYHPGLSVVAQCRMCAVEIEKMPKLQTACSTPATDGMVVHTQSERSKKNRKAVMEFLLINHPLDCPICDKAGECDLQDHSYKYGDPYMRYTEERRTYVDLDMGPVIKKNMNRCIHCTRCIRFGTEVAGIHEMVAVQRGNSTEITTIDGRPLETDYAGNYADICPTGSLTLKDFRFHKRAWLLKKTPTVCEGCSRGCNMEVHHEGGRIYRCIPRENQEINRHWMCDEGRFNYHYTQDAGRITMPRVRMAGGEFESKSWSEAIQFVKAMVERKKICVGIGSDLTQEEAAAILEFTKDHLGGAPVAHFGTNGVTTSKDDRDADRILKRSSKTANLHGLEKLGIRPFGSTPSGVDVVVLFRGGRSELPKLSGVSVIGVGVFQESETTGFAAVLPGAAFTEKTGTIVNFQDREQRFQMAVPPPKGAKQTSEILMQWVNSAARKAGVA